MVINANAETVLRNELGRYFELKEESIGPLKLYLGGQVRKVELENGAKAWAFGSLQYVQAAVSNIETYLAKHEQWKLPNKASIPVSTSY
mgnify:CR=1 FL=1